MDELAAKIAELPGFDQPDAYLVFADWLQSRADPWGELIVVDHRASVAEDPVQRTELELEPEVVEAIVASPSVFRLRSLDLSGGTLDDRGARVLAGAAGRIAHLEIDLSWNHLSSDGRRRIADALPFAKVGPVYESRRRGSRGVRLPAFYMRYMATVE